MFLKDDTENLIPKVPMVKNRLFVLSIQTDMVKCLTSCYKDSSWLWHLQFWHINFGGLKIMVSNGMVKGLPPIH